MKIAIVCDPVDLDQKTGISVYCEQLVKRLKEDKSNEYVFFHMRENALFDGTDNIVIKSGASHGIINAMRMLYKKFFVLPKEFRKRGIELVHELNMIGPYIFDPFRRYKAVVTIFDLTPVIFKRYHSLLNVLGFNLFVGRSAQTSDAIIAISEATKNDIVTTYRVSADKVHVTLLGSKILEVKEAADPIIDYPFILSVGTLEPRKNLKNLIRSFVRLKEAGGFDEVKLVLTGKVGWKTESLFQELNLNVKYADQIIMTGFLSDEQLVRLYKDCTVFAYPSLYEGFGLPVLEAMSLGAPVITSNVSSLPEVAGECGILVDPNSVEEICSALKALLSDDSKRETMGKAGKIRSQLFSWEKCASQTIDLYRALAGK